MESLLKDLRFGLRSLLRRPGFTFVAVVTLALGVGVNTAMFSVVHALLFKPLPVADADGLVSVAIVRGGTLPTPLSYPDYRSYRDADEVFSDAIAYSASFAQLRAAPYPSERLMVTLVSGNYFDFLGVEAEHGRTFVREESERMGGGNVIVLAYDFWQRYFEGDTSVVGRAVSLNGRPFTVIGVAPESFPGTYVLLATDGYVPVTAGAQLDAALPGQIEDRAASFFRVIARLQPGVDLEAARAATAVHGQRLEHEYPATHTGARPVLHPEPMARLEPSAAVFLPPIASAFMAIVGLVLLIACANITNLMLVRANGRQRELAIRTALGAGRMRLIQQLVTESVLLALAGGAAGLVLAEWATGIISSVRVATDVRFAFDFSLEPTAFAFAFAAALVAGIVAGLVPALQVSRTSPGEYLKDGGRAGASARKQRLQGALVAGQVAVSLVLLIFAGLFVRSMHNVARLDLGFSTEDRLTLAMDVALSGHDHDRGRRLYQRLLARVRALPVVRKASHASYVPLDIRSGTVAVFAEGRPVNEREDPTTGTNTVGIDYFETIGTPIVHGRAFTEHDGPMSPAVAIVNQELAARLWPDQDALGKRIRIDQPDAPLCEIVGVAKLARYNFPSEGPTPFVYLPFAQNYDSSQVLHVWTTVQPASVVAAIRAEVAALDPELALFDVRTLTTHVRDGKGAAVFRLGSGLAGAFGLVGAILAAIGLYGVMAYAVSERTRELGVRMALGSSPWQIVKLVLRRGLGLALAGAAAGLAVALGVTGSVADLLVGVGPREPQVLAGATVLLLVVALVASVVPAMRAARLDPLTALRDE